MVDHLRKRIGEEELRISIVKLFVMYYLICGNGCFLGEQKMKIF